MRCYHGMKPFLLAVAGIASFISVVAQAGPVGDGDAPPTSNNAPMATPPTQDVPTPPYPLSSNAAASSDANAGLGHKATTTEPEPGVKVTRQGNKIRIVGPPPPPSQPARIAMTRTGGAYVVPVLINNLIALEFFVDSGASDVTIPADVVMKLIQTGTVNGEDFIGKQTYRLADGSTMPSAVFRIRSLQVGDKVLENVRGSVAPVSGSLLLGQSFLSRFNSWSIDNTNHQLLLGSSAQ